jgi:hypothetical protein
MTVKWKKSMTVKWKQGFVASVAFLVLSGCATQPSGPNVLVLPNPGKSFQEFQSNDMTCRQWAERQIGISAQTVSNQNMVTGAIVGTAIGAGAGALMGEASGQTGNGGALGAGTGLLVGTAAGANAGQEYGWKAQQQYDYAYVQCMYAMGNQIPGQIYQYRIRQIAPAPPRKTSQVPPDYVPY